MEKILRYLSVFTLVAVTLVPVGYSSAKTNDNEATNIDSNLLYSPNHWQVVKQVFQLHVPKNAKPLEQLIIDAPSTVAVSNDIDVLDNQGKKININISVEDRRIIITFPETVKNDVNKILVALNRVQQPINGPTTIYELSAKVVGSNAEIPIGKAQFSTF
ncbi:MAG: hypothetical protein KME64_35865 [Scytonematopsis contorta HA4267-MV1]|jgi:hypothetical protein|nr:hypothetical protein [Scytonematopsis contorta HA4267-MV1]